VTVLGIAVLLVRAIREGGDATLDARTPARFVLVLLAAQLVLGAAAALTVYGRGQLVDPALSEVLIPSAHVATGALILATTVVIALRLHRAAPAPVPLAGRAGISHAGLPEGQQVS
jgi:hypothetical protein